MAGRRSRPRPCRNGTTGGSAADAARVYTVSDRNALVAALAFPDATPKIIRIAGVIDANVDADNQPLTCADYARPDRADRRRSYSLDAFLAAYDPRRVGPRQSQWPAGTRPRGLGRRAAGARAHPHPGQHHHCRRHARCGPARRLARHPPGSTSGNQPMNVIIRNLSFEDSYDCFPQWAPTDGATGNWNSLYDAISVRNATHVWIDHNASATSPRADATLPHVLRPDLPGA